MHSVRDRAWFLAGLALAGVGIACHRVAPRLNPAAGGYPKAWLAS
jgi:hypothetical protein